MTSEDLSPIDRDWISSQNSDQFKKALLFQKTTAEIEENRMARQALSNMQTFYAQMRDKLTDEIWPEKARYLLDYTKLDALTVSFEHLLCPQKCCELDSKAFNAFRGGFKLAHPKSVEVEYTRNEANGFDYTDDGILGK